MTTHGRAGGGQRGLSLVEALVAITILAIGVAIALLLYDVSRKSFKRGENATEQQQAVRIAFDTLIADLLLAGHNYNPDGDKSRTDEQIEGAFETAVIFRADFDGENEANPGPYQVVSTGNHEVVAYVLANDTSSQSLTFYADLNTPRTGSVSPQQVDNIALTQDSPPYILYRITWEPDGTEVRTPLVDNVYSMRFEYYNLAGNLMAAPGGDPDETPTRDRASVRRIAVDLVGMTRDPDLQYRDPGDPNPATQRYRKFQLAGDVTPRNLGMVGARDLDVFTEPSEPTGLQLISGHCGLLAIWDANDPLEQIVQYRLSYGTSCASLTRTANTSALEAYVPMTLSDMGDGYCAVLRAVDANGNVSPPSSQAQATMQDQNVPGSTPLEAGGGDNVIRLGWDKVQVNTTGSPTADPKTAGGESPYRDWNGGAYEIFRKEGTGNFQPGEAGVVAFNRPGGAEAFDDRTVVNCQPYSYRIRAVDSCGSEGALSAVVSASSAAAEPPAAPESLIASLASGSTSHGDVHLEWEEVQRDVLGNPIRIEDYDVWCTAASIAGDEPSTSAYAYLASVTGGETSFRQRVATAIQTCGRQDDVSDAGIGSFLLNSRLWYRVKAKDRCNPVNESSFSNAASPECLFDGSVLISKPDLSQIQQVQGVVPVEVTILNGDPAMEYTRVVVRFYNAQTSALLRQAEWTPAVPGNFTSTAAGGNPIWIYQDSPTVEGWAVAPGAYRIEASVTNLLGCTKPAPAKQFEVGGQIGCCVHFKRESGGNVALRCVDNSCTEFEVELMNDGCRTFADIYLLESSWRQTHTDARLQELRLGGRSMITYSQAELKAPPMSQQFCFPDAQGDEKPCGADPFNSPRTIGVDAQEPLRMRFSRAMFDRVKGDQNDFLYLNWSIELLDAEQRPLGITSVCSEPANFTYVGR
jgi:prepilin-type N-terminal cleavage/methylation domain-containing protein